VLQIIIWSGAEQLKARASVKLPPGFPDSRATHMAGKPNSKHDAVSWKGHFLLCNRMLLANRIIIRTWTLSVPHTDAEEAIAPV